MASANATAPKATAKTHKEVELFALKYGTYIMWLAALSFSFYYVVLLPGPRGVHRFHRPNVRLRSSNAHLKCSNTHLK